MVPLVVGQHYLIPAGDNRGIRVRVTHVGKLESKGEALGDQETDDVFAENGEVFYFPTPEDPMVVVERDIKEYATRLKGALLLKQSMLHPVATQKEIARLLSKVKI